MSKSKEYQTGGKFLARLGHGEDLLSELTDFCKSKGIETAFISAIGALENATVGYYDQKAREYRSTSFNEHLEITHLGGNLSIKDGKPIVHAHIILAREGGETLSGHLMSPSVIFACEAFISELRGETLERGFDEETGLPLWKFEE